MEKAAKFLGIDKGLGEAAKNVLLLLAAAVSLSFTAGSYFGSAKDLPARVETIERKQDRAETRQEAILTELRSLGQDVREMRAVMMRGSK